MVTTLADGDGLSRALDSVRLHAPASVMSRIPSKGLRRFTARYAYRMRRVVACVSVASACACGRPFLARDGSLVVPQAGARGASVVTAEGLEFHDTTDVPERVVVRDPYEPWRAPLGFLIPSNGRFTRTSSPTLVTVGGLAVTLRPSDSRVPSWGGEVLVRVDVAVAAAPGEARSGEDVGIVVEGRGEDTILLVEAALSRLGGRDRVVVVDAAGSRVVVPSMPASNRSLITAAVAHRLEAWGSEPIDRTRAVAHALDSLSRAAPRRVLVLSDGQVAPSPAVGAEDADDGVPVAVVGTTGSTSVERKARARAVFDFIPAAGSSAFRDVVISFDGTPAPSHVLEASGGDARWQLQGGQLALGDVRAGDERTEVVRVTVPAWTPGSSFTLHVGTSYDDLSRGGARGAAEGEMTFVYDDDIERLAESRHGDVIAYASALATLARLDAAFIGGQSKASDVRPIARLHARSLALLAQDTDDPAAAAQAALLEALLAAIE